LNENNQEPVPESEKKAALEAPKASQCGQMNARQGPPA